MLILGVLFFIIGVVLIVLGVAIFPINFNGSAVAPNAAFFVPGMLLTAGGISLFVYSLIPKIQKSLIQTAKYIQEDNKEDLTAMANTSAEISGEAIKTTVKNIKEGLEDSKYCKYCGELIDGDSLFCNKCGKKQ